MIVLDYTQLNDFNSIDEKADAFAGVPVLAGVQASDSVSGATGIR